MVAYFPDGETEAERCSGLRKASKPPSLGEDGGDVRYHASRTPKERAVDLLISPQSQAAPGCLLCPPLPSGLTFLRAVSWARRFRREPSRVRSAP